MEQNPYKAPVEGAEGAKEKTNRTRLFFLLGFLAGSVGVVFAIRQMIFAIQHGRH